MLLSAQGGPSVKGSLIERYDLRPGYAVEEWGTCFAVSTSEVMRGDRQQNVAQRPCFSTVLVDDSRKREVGK